MASLVKYVVVMCAGVFFYWLSFLFIIHKPLTVGITKAYIDQKLNYLSAIAGERKIAILAGSNGRFSHRCETIEQITGIRCVNLSITAHLSLEWQMDKYGSYFKPGDVLYLPIEYSSPHSRPALVDEGALYLVAYDHHALFQLYDWKQLLGALFYFDIKYVFSGLGEMVLSAMGKQRRFSLATLTLQGDERGHAETKAVAYRTFVAQLEAPSISRSSYQTENRLDEIRRVLEWAKSAGVHVVGGLPTTVEDARIPPEATSFMQRFYGAYGQCFLVLPNQSLYPRTAFFDAVFHLNETNQKRHSSLIAPYLAEVARSGHCPAS